MSVPSVPTPARCLATVLLLLLVYAMMPAGVLGAQDMVAQDVFIASGGPEVGGAFAQDMVDVLGRSFPSRLRIIAILSGSSPLALADLCAGKADLAILPADLPEAAAGCPLRKGDGKKRGLRLVAQLADASSPGARSWLLVGVEANRRSVPAVEALVALMFQNMDVLAAGPRRQRWSGADAFGIPPGWIRDETAAQWIAGLRDQCRARPQDEFCASAGRAWK